ncbi:MAG: hypothetical protein LLG14_26440 [Nocardiaceae bacterium]|nr:hypothetical protein [Nocardiaceae bacterium]
MVRKPVAALVVALAAFLSGCADNVDTGMGVTVVTAPSTIAPSVQPSTSVPTSEVSAPAATVESRPNESSREEYPAEKPWVGDGTVAADQFKTVDQGYSYVGYRFVSPSKNLICGFNLHFWGYDVGCQSPDVPKPVDSSTYAEPCMGGVVVTVEGPMHACFQGPYFGDGQGFRVLQYGETIRVGDLACTSKRTGMTCVYGSRGFTLSREEVDLF